MLDLAGRATRATARWGPGVYRQSIWNYRREDEAPVSEPRPFEVYESGALLHGTKADHEAGALLVPGYGSNFEHGRTANNVYVTATLDAATWVLSSPWATGVVGSTP